LVRNARDRRLKETHSDLRVRVLSPALNPWVAANEKVLEHRASRLRVLLRTHADASNITRSTVRPTLRCAPLKASLGINDLRVAWFVGTLDRIIKRTKSWTAGGSKIRCGSRCLCGAAGKQREQCEHIVICFGHDRVQATVIWSLDAAKQTLQSRGSSRT
jgi:hypothetical protein